MKKGSPLSFRIPPIRRIACSSLGHQRIVRRDARLHLTDLMSPADPSAVVARLDESDEAANGDTLALRLGVLRQAIIASSPVDARATFGAMTADARPSTRKRNALLGADSDRVPYDAPPTWLDPDAREHDRRQPGEERRARRRVNCAPP